MENYASAALSGMGYMLQQERNTNFVAQQQKQETFSTPMPSMDNVYHSEH